MITSLSDSRDKSPCWVILAVVCAGAAQVPTGRHVYSTLSSVSGLLVEVRAHILFTFHWRRAVNLCLHYWFYFHLQCAFSAFAVRCFFFYFIWGLILLSFVFCDPLVFRVRSAFIRSVRLMFWRCACVNNRSALIDLSLAVVPVVRLYNYVLSYSYLWFSLQWYFCYSVFFVVCKVVPNRPHEH